MSADANLEDDLADRPGRGRRKVRHVRVLREENHEHAGTDREEVAVPGQRGHILSLARY